MKLKRFVSVVVFAVLLGNMPGVYAAKNSDVMRVYKTVVTDERYTYMFGFSRELMDDYGVDEAYVSEELKKLISDIIDVSVSENEKGNINEDNLREEVKGIAISRMMFADPAFVGMVTDILSEEEYMSFISGEIPDRFKGLSAILYPEIKKILGYDIKDSKIIFDDMQNHEWACEAVNYLFERDVVNGVSDFMFAPSEKITREQFAKLVCTAFNVGINYENQKDFSDVPKDSWYYSYVQKMASNDFINGMDKDVFGTGYNITRQDMAVIMYRVGEERGLFSSKNPDSLFSDENDISSYAVNAVNSLKAYGIVKGDDKGNFNPLLSTTRAEGTQMIYNMLMYVENLNQ